MVVATSARTRFKQKVRDIVNGRDQFVASEITQEALAAMRAEDPGFDVAFTDELAGLMAYESTLSSVSETRQRGIFQTGRRTRRQTTKTPGERLMGWIEHAGDRHVRTSQMTRPIARRAAGIRRGRGLRELLVAGYFERIADVLPDDDVTIGEHFEPAEIEAIWRETVEPDEEDDDDTNGDNGATPVPQLTPGA